ncbi:MAG: ABC transporter ATP-binding protein [Deltaproteobacteria bacterium]|nr:ABC transporter ATP-binding protein [Deltaproteobacteria bacterium]MBW2542249.1 ABC transporter ATP-binding protein [Deltaproteobacteria bacterium]
MDSAVRFRNVCLRYGKVVALDGIDLEIGSGEFFGILGPSGSGKTSCLRLIAGFDRPSDGAIELHGRSAASVPPYDRDVNTVFQDYALFPHMTIEQNVGFGLMVKGVNRRERRTRVGEMLEMVRLEGLGERRPSQLSGGQRQRVALARALVNRPSVLLLDEPLGALDLKLRQQMQVELRSLQRTLGITFIFVTHDQGEALSMSDRLAVFNRGRVEQVGTPREIYEKPATRFSAEFVGDSNIVERLDAGLRSGERGVFSLRPEKVHLSTREPAAREHATSVAGEVADVQFHGASVRYVVDVPDGRSMTAVVGNLGSRAEQPAAEPGTRVWLNWSSDDLHRLRESESG